MGILLQGEKFLGNPATDKKSGARNIMTQLLSPPVILDNIRNQVDECVANADNEEKLTELRQSSVQQLQEATLNVTMNNDLSHL